MDDRGILPKSQGIFAMTTGSPITKVLLMQSGTQLPKGARKGLVAGWPTVGTVDVQLAQGNQ